MKMQVCLAFLITQIKIVYSHYWAEQIYHVNEQRKLVTNAVHVACLDKLLCFVPEQMQKKLVILGSLQMVVMGMHILPC